MPQSGWGVHPKTKHVSMILSEKRQLESHKLRHVIADAGLPIDLYGARGTPIGYDKSIAYRDYRFAVVVDTTREQNYFSEHLLDAVSFGCIPIYWGCPNLSDFLDARGVVPFTSIDDLARLLSFLNEEGDVFYRLHEPYLLFNLGLLPSYRVTEDWQALHVYPEFQAVPV
jgi:hypothetical protein